MESLAWRKTLTDALVLYSLNLFCCSVRAVSTIVLTTGTPPQVIVGGHHEEARDRIDIPVFSATDGLGMGCQDLISTRRIVGKAWRDIRQLQNAVVLFSHTKTVTANSR